MHQLWNGIAQKYFCQISSKLILIILSYTVSKLVHFLRECIYIPYTVFRCKYWSVLKALLHERSYNVDKLRGGIKLISKSHLCQLIWCVVQHVKRVLLSMVYVSQLIVGPTACTQMYCRPARRAECELSYKSVAGGQKGWGTLWDTTPLRLPHCEYVILVAFLNLIDVIPSRGLWPLSPPPPREGEADIWWTSTAVKLVVKLPDFPHPSAHTLKQNQVYISTNHRINLAFDPHWILFIDLWQDVVRLCYN